MNLKPQIIAAALLVGMLIPYFATLLLADRIQISPQNPPSASEWSVKTEHGSVDAEEYLIGLTAAQIPAAYHVEALKAQTVIARTWLLESMGENKTIEEQDLQTKAWTEKEMKENWKDEWEKNQKKIAEAVKTTQKEVLTYEGKKINALYHPVSSGTTRTDTSQSCPYLKSKESPYDIEAEGYLQMKIFTPQEFAEALQKIGTENQISSENILASIQILAKDSSSYIEQIQIDGVQFQGIQVAEALGLSSCCMSFEDYEGKIRVICRGIGHGYGMSQWGANCMVQQGSSYQDILNYYYSDILITSE